MSIKKTQKPISETLSKLLKEDKLTEKQKTLWVKYLSFLNTEQIKDLCEIIDKDKESFNSLMSELENSIK